jgi:hypothetical protein
MNANITSEDVRIIIKKFNPKIAFFKPEDQRRAKKDHEMWYIGQFEGQNLTNDFIIQLLEKNEIEGLASSNAHVVEVHIPIVEETIIGHTPMELLEHFMKMDNSNEDKVEENNDIIMRTILKDMATCIVDEGVDNLAHLNKVVQKYSGVYESFQKLFWISNIGAKSLSKKKAKPFMELFRTSGLYWKFYKNVVEPEIKASYPHWFLNN